MRVAVCAVAVSFGLMGCTLFGGQSSTPVSVASPSPSALPSPVRSPLPSPSPTPAASPTPSPPPGLYLQILQSDYGGLSAQTEQGAMCNARATLPNGQDASGVKNPQVADANGMVTWTYPQPSTEGGNGVHTVTCTKGGLTATQTQYFLVGA